MGDGLIDLDRSPPAPPRPSSRWRRRRARRPPGRVRLHRTVALLAATALLLGGGAAPPARGFGPPLRIGVEPRTGFALTDEAVYVAAADFTELRRYTLDGALRWSAPVEHVYPPNLVVVGDLVLAGTDSGVGRTYALDRGTGAVRWATAGTVLAVFPDTAVLSGVDGDGAAHDAGVDLTAVALADGRPVWRRQVAAGQSERLVRTVRDSFGGYMVTRTGRVRTDGSGELVDLATGDRRALVDWPVDGFGNDRAAAEFGAVLLAVGPGAGGRGLALRAFASDTLRPLWTVDTGSESWGNGCGPWLCVPEGTGTRALDATTGAERWRVAWSSVTARSDARRALGSLPAAGAQPPRVGVVDLATGATVATFPGWRGAGSPDRRWAPLLREVGPDRMRVAALDLDRLVAYPIGEFRTGRTGRCQVSRRDIACLTGDAEIRIWRYHPDDHPGARD